MTKAKTPKQRKLLMGERARLLSYAEDKASPEPEKSALNEINKLMIIEVNKFAAQSTRFWSSISGEGKRQLDGKIGSKRGLWIYRGRKNWSSDHYESPNVVVECGITSNSGGGSYWVTDEKDPFWDLHKTWNSRTNAYTKARAALIADYKALIYKCHTWEELIEVWPEAATLLPPLGGAPSTALVAFSPDSAERIRADMKRRYPPKAEITETETPKEEPACGL